MLTVYLELAVQVPCLLRCKTHAFSVYLPFFVTCTVRERPHIVIVGANLSKVPFICDIVITFYVSAVSIAT